MDNIFTSWRKRRTVVVLKPLSVIWTAIWHLNMMVSTLNLKVLTTHASLSFLTDFFEYAIVFIYIYMFSCFWFNLKCCDIDNLRKWPVKWNKTKSKTAKQICAEKEGLIAIICLWFYSWHIRNTSVTFAFRLCVMISKYCLNLHSYLHVDYVLVKICQPSDFHQAGLFVFQLSRQHLWLLSHGLLGWPWRSANMSWHIQRTCSWLEKFMTVFCLSYKWGQSLQSNMSVTTFQQASDYMCDNAWTGVLHAVLVLLMKNALYR